MIRIRTAREEDIGHILSMARQVSDMILKHRSGFFGETGEFRTDPQVYAQALRAEDSIIFVAEEDEHGVVGYVYAIVQREPDDLIAIPYVSMDEIAVKTTHQGPTGGISKSPNWQQLKVGYHLENASGDDHHGKKVLWNSDGAQWYQQYGRANRSAQ